MAGERTLPGLGLTAEWTLGTSGWKAGMDANLLKLSALTHISVVSATIPLPANPADGVLYVVATGQANEDKIALRDKGGWIYFTPLRGMRAHVQSSDTFIFYNGTDWLVEATTLEVAKDDVTFNEVVGRLNFIGNGVSLEAGGAPGDVEVHIDKAATFGELPQVDFETVAIADGQTIRWDGVRQVFEPADFPQGGGDPGGGGGIEEAPEDGKLYGRKNATWAEIVASGGGAVGGPSQTRLYSNNNIANISSSNFATKASICEPITDIYLYGFYGTVDEVAGATYAWGVYEVNEANFAITAVVVREAYTATATRRNSRRVMLPNRIVMTKGKVYAIGHSRTDQGDTQSTGIYGGTGTPSPFVQRNAYAAYAAKSPVAGTAAGISGADPYHTGVIWQSLEDAAAAGTGGLPNASGTGETRPLVRPSLSMFDAPINGSDSTIKDIDDRGISVTSVTRRPSATGFVRIERDLPASGNFAIITGFQAKMWGNEFPSVGHMLRAPNDKRITAEYITVSGTPKVEHNNWSSDPGFVTAKITQVAPMMMGGIWFKTEYVNGVVSSFLSADGVQWVRLFAGDSYLDQRPTKYGLFIKPAGGNGNDPLYIKALFYHSEIIPL